MSDYDYNFNGADEQTDPFGLIPNNTFAKVIMIIRSDNEDALIDSKSSDAKMLDCELTVLEGKFKNRKFWQNMVVSGGKEDKNGNSIAGNITRATLRAILESSRNIKSDDASKKAVTARQVKSFWDFNEMEFIANIKIEKAKKNSGYDDQNKISLVVTPDKPEYQMIMSGKEVESEDKPAPKKEANELASVKTNPLWGGKQKQEPASEESASTNGDVPAWAK